METQTISRKREILRFIVTGLASAIADFLVSELFLTICAAMPDIWKSIISITAGFIVGVIVNYFLSTYWVFKGVDNEKAVKTPIFIVKFVILSAVALGLSWGTYELCHIAFKAWWGYNIYNQGIKEIFTFTFWNNVEFWLFCVAFVLKTLVGLIWNYFTRKYILYKNKNS